MKFYRDGSLNDLAVMRHFLDFEVGMPVARLMFLEDSPDSSHAQVLWNGITQAQDSLEQLAVIAEDVPQMLESILNCKTMSDKLVNKARCKILL